MGAATDLWEEEEEKCSRTVLAENAADYTALKAIATRQENSAIPEEQESNPKIAPGWPFLAGCRGVGTSLENTWSWIGPYKSSCLPLFSAFEMQMQFKPNTTTYSFFLFQELLNEHFKILPTGLKVLSWSPRGLTSLKAQSQLSQEPTPLL